MWKRIIHWFYKYHDPLEILLLILTIIVAISLYIETKRQVGVAKDALTYELKKDSIQLGQTQEALDIARDNNIQQNRPWVFPSVPTFIDVGMKYGQPQIRMVYTNSGKSPAYKFKEVVRFEHWAGADDPRYFTEPPDSTARVIAPGISESVDSRKFIPQFDTVGLHRFWVNGRIWYSDQWHMRHFYTFVYQWQFIDSTWVRFPQYETADTNSEN